MQEFLQKLNYESQCTQQLCEEVDEINQSESLILLSQQMKIKTLEKENIQIDSDIKVIRNALNAQDKQFDGEINEVALELQTEQVRLLKQIQEADMQISKISKEIQVIIQGNSQ
ncbi:Hypothetical_protein [Hexamita inflata]|uniref:Hypothetical_protein n=1 Tax=Hexamita inflata TaxID=28002 RepID=A0AA86Q8S7_9EUKA|nr:Hypothetical protein HINF_LOCUS39207 [Hexamita inflata]